jgi:hypothetical protein
MARSYIRRPLRDREHPLSDDVADAINRLAGIDPATLPVAMNKADVVDQLIVIAHEDGDGTIAMPRPAAKKAMQSAWMNRLSNSAVFQSGYKHFESLAEYGNFPVVPVTDYFFTVVLGEKNGDLVAVLDGMSDFEVQNSLPKRRTRVRIEGKEDEFVRDADDNIAQFGELAGVIVFPPDSKAKLMIRWLERQTNVAMGSMNHVTDALGHARPKAVAIDTLRTAVTGIHPVISRALPRPAKKP